MHDYKNFRYISSDNKDIELNYMENETLKVLLLEKGNIVKYEYLCQYLYHSTDIDVYKNVLRAHIHRLRKKLNGELSIVTRNKIGYIIR